MPCLSDNLIALASLWAEQMGPPPPRYVPPALKPTRQVSAGQERHLIARFQAGDRRAGDALLRLHDKALRLACWKRRGQGEEADLLQDARLELLEHARRFDLGRDSSLMDYAHKGVAGRVLRSATRATTDRRRSVSIDEPLDERGRTIGDMLRAGASPEAILIAFEDYERGMRP